MKNFSYRKNLRIASVKTDNKIFLDNLDHEDFNNFSVNICIKESNFHVQLQRSVNIPSKIDMVKMTFDICFV